MSTPTDLPLPASSPNIGKRAIWLKRLHQWHWISSAICLAGMLMFSITGITLNHASQIEAKPKVTKQALVLPAQLHNMLRQAAAQHADKKAPLPAEIASWLQQKLRISVQGMEAEWSPDDAYIALPRPGGDAWLRLATNGTLEYEVTDRGWLSWFNDLHKGRHTGVLWSWFIDLFGVASLLFAITGLLILQYHAKNRASTWPILGLGVVLPLLIAILFIH